MKDVQSLFDQHFESLLVAHGVTPIKYKLWMTANGEYPAFRAFFHKSGDAEKTSSVEIQICLGQEFLVEETVAAFGETDVEAVNRAMFAFNIAMAHPVLAASGIRVPSDQVIIEKWRMRDGLEARGYIGNICLRYSEGGNVAVPADWIERMGTAVGEAKLRKGFNWISAYSSRLKDGELIASASLNNSPWEEGLAATVARNWPSSRGFYGARAFAVIVV